MPSEPSGFNFARNITLDRNGAQVRPPPASIAICRVLRRMRGGSQSQLVQCCDDHFYVAKFMGNPQGNRTLINELMAHRLMTHLGASVPKVCLLSLPESVKKNEEIFFQVGNRRVPPQSGLHLGSKCPANPEKTAIFDFLPANLLPKISNINEFASMFVLDRWLYNTDKRQAIFLRDQSVKSSVKFRAYFVDHGMTFGGVDWQLRDVPLHGLAFPRSIYSLIDMRTLTMATVQAIQSISPATLDAATEGLPAVWFGPDDRESLRTLSGGLRKRWTGLSALVRRHLDALNL